MKVFFSLRRKILLMLFGVSLASGLVFLYTSITTFKKDKLAYIFETNNSIINGISDQFKKELKLSTAAVKVLVSKLKSDGTFGTPAETAINAESPVDKVEVFKLSPNKELSLFTSLSKAEIDQTVYSINGIKSKVLNQLTQKEKGLFILDNVVVIAEQSVIENENYVLVYYFNSDAIQTFFNDEKSFSSLLISSSGSILKSDKDFTAEYVQQNFGDLFQESKLLNSATSKIQSTDKKDWLLTSVTAGFENYYFVSLVDEAKAMSALNSLVTNSILIFILMLFVIIIIGVFVSTYLTSRLSLLSSATKKVIEGDLKTVVEPQGNDEITELTTNFNHMTSEIVRLMSETAHKARMESELKTAQAVQETLFPKPETKFTDLHIKGHYISASECGGDWWHYSEDTEKIYLWIADATGHGASAALLTSAAKSAVSLIENMNLSPAESITLLNRAICSVSKENMMMTCFLAVFNKTSKKLIYVNASHEAPILLKAVDELKKKDLIHLNENSCPRLGQSVDSEYVESEIQLVVGDRLLFYTDGIPDIQNLAGEPLKERGFIKHLLASVNSHLEFSAFVDHFTDSLVDYRQKTELVDDVTYCFTEVS
jgi:sigma-B regulation protein RsbU (phosphoserine phosphatase)